jgi:hypothetical protein
VFCEQSLPSIIEIGMKLNNSTKLLAVQTNYRHLPKICSVMLLLIFSTPSVHQEKEMEALSNALVLYTSPRIIRIMKSRKFRWAGHVARM